MNEQDKALLLDTLRKDGQAPRVPDTALHQLEEVCRVTGLDWRTRLVYLIERGGKWRVELSIDGFRAIAAQDPDYAGQAGPQWALGPDGPWTDIPPSDVPYAARVGVYRKGFVEPTWGVAKFADYATGQMYRKFPSTMIAKCAEALALRKAFPQRLGNLYSAEEMAQADTPKQQPRAERIHDLRPDFGSLLDAVTSLEELKRLGAEIQASSLGLDEKMVLSRLYNTKKQKMGW